MCQRVVASSTVMDALASLLRLVNIVPPFRWRHVREDREVRNDERQIASQLRKIEAIGRRGKVLATFLLREAQRDTSGTIKGQSASVNKIVVGSSRGVDPKLIELITRRWTPGCEEWTGDETVGNMRRGMKACVMSFTCSTSTT